MKKIILMLMLLCLPLFAFADVPDGIWAQNPTPAELVTLMQAAMAEELPDAVICTYDGGTPMAVYEYGSGFCIAQRSDGLMMLCCFCADGDALRLMWHNDLLLSSMQEIEFTTSGPVWHGDFLPLIGLEDNDRLVILLDQWSGTLLRLEATYMPEGWRVTELGVYAQNGDVWTPLLLLPQDCLSRDIFLASCHPMDWNAAP